MKGGTGFPAAAVRHVGIDEAGLGPVLGPFCAAALAFDAPAGTALPVPAPLRRAFRGEDPALVLADSKRVFQGAAGLRRGEATALAVLGAEFGAGGLFPLDLPHIWRAGGLDPERVGSRHPWYLRAPRALPLWSDPGACELAATRLRACLDGPKLGWGGARFRMLPEGAFNDELDRHGNKAEVSWSVIAELLRWAVEEPGPPRREVLVDRQGGRRFYAERVARLFPAWKLRVLREGAAESSYALEHHADERRARVRFAIRADANAPHVALASILAKYLRESAMLALNSWFCARCPGLRPTAGYPLDGRRWLADLRAIARAPEIPSVDLVRAR